MPLGEIVDDHSAMLGISADDIRAAGNTPQGGASAASGTGDDLGAYFRDPAVQDAILDPPTLELDSEVLVNDWRCAAGHVTTAYDAAVLARCGTTGCRQAVVRDTERVQHERYSLRLAFSDFDIRKRKVWEHVESLRQVFLREMVADNPRAVLDPLWIANHPNTAQAGAAAVATVLRTRETLMYLANCPWEVVEGIENADVQGALFVLLSAYREWAEKRTAEKNAQAAAARSGRPPLSHGFGNTAGPGTRSSAS